MKKSWLLTCSFVAMAATLGTANSARAQTIDYGSFETLFGEPVTSSATGTPQRVSDAPANMTIITADEIRQSGSRNIPDILSRVPGLDILQGGVNSFDVGVRGYQQPFQPRLLVLVDGRQVFIDDYSRTLWDNIPVNVDDIRQIEIVKGASSALFGSNAAGGVINIVTYSPVYDNSNVANGTYGTQNTYIADGTATIKGDWGGTKFTAGGYAADEFHTGRYALDSRPGKPGHSYVASNTILQVTPDLQLNAEFTYSTSEANTLDAADYYLIGDQRTTTYSARVGANWNTPYGLITTNNYWNHSFVDIIEPTNGGFGPGQAGPPYGLTTDILVDQLQDQFKVGTDHTFRVGLEYRYKWFHSDTQQLEQQAPATAEYAYAVSGMWLWQINDQLSLTNAVRFDTQSLQETGQLSNNPFFTASDYNNRINVFSANSDLVYKPTDKDTIRIGYGRGVQLPSFLENSWGIIQHFGNITADYQANPKIKPTIVEDYSIDYQRKVPEIYSVAKISPYYEINRDIITSMAINVGNGNQVINGTGFQVITDENAGNSRGYGVELQVKGSHPDGYRWDASYSFSRVMDSGDVKSLLDLEGSAPQHHFRLLLGYTTGPWEFDAHGQYLTSTNQLRSTDGGQTFAPTLTDGYATLSGRIGYKIDDRFTVAVSGTDLNRASIGKSPFPAIERQGFLTLTGKF